MVGCLILLAYLYAPQFNEVQARMNGYELSAPHQTYGIGMNGTTWVTVTTAADGSYVVRCEERHE